MSAKLQGLNRFENLSDAEIRTVVAAGRVVTLPAQWALFGEKTPADKAYLIVEGTVSVRKGGQEVATLGPGDVIGEIGIIEHTLRSASVVTTSPLEAVHFTREALEQLIDQVPAFGEALRATVADRRD